MPKAKMKEETEYALPEGVPFPAVLSSVTVKTIEYFKKDQYGNKTSEKASFDKWIWEFKITDGDYAGMRAWGETEDQLTTREDNKVRQWSTTLLNIEDFEVGQDLDTDTLIGLPCLITVRHDEPRQKRDGGFFYGCPVDDVFPASGVTDYV